MSLFSHICERIDKNYVDIKDKKIIVFPYGKGGCVLENALGCYGLAADLIIDNFQKSENKEIKKFDTLAHIDPAVCVLLIASDSEAAVNSIETFLESIQSSIKIIHLFETKEEKLERLRLEKEQEKLRLEKEQEREKIRLEREERERIRLEREEEKERLHLEASRKGFIKRLMKAIEEKLTDTQKKYRDQLLKKINDGTYCYEETKCLCGASEDEIIGKRDIHGLPVQNVICRQCGLVRINPRITQESYNQYYDDEFRYINLQFAEEYRLIHSWFVGRKRGDAFLDFIAADIEKWDKNILILDIGCGSGGMLYEFKIQGYQNTLGIDMDSSCVTYGRNKGMNLSCVSSRDLSWTESHQYDLVILSHVFEHFLDIKSELEVISYLLKPGGYLFISTPGRFGYERYRGVYNIFDGSVFRFGHTYGFSLEILSDIMAVNGFELVRGNQEIMALFQYTGVSVPIQGNCDHYEQSLDYMFYSFMPWNKAHKEYIKYIKFIRDMDLSQPAFLYGTSEETEQFMICCKLLKGKLNIRLFDRDAKPGDVVMGVPVEQPNKSMFQKDIIVFDNIDEPCQELLHDYQANIIWLSEKLA